MQLSRLAEGISGLLSTGRDARISGLCCDSRRLKPGELFFALPGVNCDGREYVPAALEAGAAALVLAEEPEVDYGVPVLVARNIRRSMAQMARNYYGDPSAEALVIGITGTNGKTTISYLLESILREAGYAPAVFGTVDYRFGDEKHEASHTTPESIELMRIMAEFRGAGADAMILEVSSHALEQHRVDGISFDVAVFTNLTPEHLDYHGTMDAYFHSKARLFDLVPLPAGVINLDDSYGVWLKEKYPTAQGFSRTKDVEVGVSNLVSGVDGQRGELVVEGEKISFTSPLVGDFNVSNILAATAAAHRAGVSLACIARGIAVAPQVPGRLEKVENERGVLALVDYAHTSDALSQVLGALAGIVARRRLTLVGCGGDRDPKKRPLMAAAAVQASDLAILTSDNPRTEDPLAILEQMRQGAIEVAGPELSLGQAREGAAGFVIIPDRREAIDFAVSLAESGDILLVAGKGHEDYQILGTTKVHFDDREELRRAFATAPAERGGR